MFYDFLIMDSPLFHLLPRSHPSFQCPILSKTQGFFLSEASVTSLDLYKSKNGVAPYAISFFAPYALGSKVFLTKSCTASLRIGLLAQVAPDLNCNIDWKFRGLLSRKLERGLGFLAWIFYMLAKKLWNPVIVLYTEGRKGQDLLVFDTWE